MAFWEFEFHGRNLEDLHGLNLRDEIRKIAAKSEIKGIVKNNKEKGTVKVMVEIDDEMAEKFFNKILDIDNPLIDGKIDMDKSTKTKVSYDSEKNAPEYKDFHIKREDELTEMVWALQAAGKVFENEGRIKAKSLNRALKYGIDDVSAGANEMQNSQGHERKFVLISIENYLAQCPSDNEDLMYNLYDLYQFCQEINNSTTPGDKRYKDNLLKIADLCTQIKEKLK